MNLDIEKLKKLSGDPLANCLSCYFGRTESDGEYGQTYCGCYCDKATRLGKRLGIEIDTVEDLGWEADTEKDCWFPQLYDLIWDYDSGEGTDEDSQAYEHKLRTFIKKTEKAFSRQMNRPINFRLITLGEQCALSIAG